MRIKQKTRQTRRDFWAIYECEHCGHETPEKTGYDDQHFHQNVIPKMVCPECGEKGLGQQSHPRYPESFQI